MVKKILFPLLGLFFINSLFAAVNDSAIKIKWGYKGNISPEHWGQLDKQFLICATGKFQSPINIPKKNKKTENNLQINYSPAPLTIMDDGTTRLMLGTTQTIFNDGHSIQVNFSESAKETIQFAGQTYGLKQFHFHSPSETTWQGQNFPMEIHFVHQGSNGKAAVIAVFIKAGKENAELEKIITHLPHDEGQDHTIMGVQINPDALLPSKKNYYSFIGSLTTPPCTEGLQWFVMESPIFASPAQIQELRKALGGDNARPVQPLNHRKIFYSEKK